MVQVFNLPANTGRLKTCPTKQPGRHATWLPGWSVFLAKELPFGGLLGKAPKIYSKTATGWPQMLQLSLNGKRLYVTDSLASRRDNQFFNLNIAKHGSIMLQIEADTNQGARALHHRFFADFGREPDGPARAHEMNFPLGNSTSDVWTEGRKETQPTLFGTTINRG